MKKKICIITGSRAEWGLFYPLARRIQSEKSSFTLQIIATGAHYSSKHGLTYREIQKDGFKITRAVPLPCAEGEKEDISKAYGLGVIGLTKALQSIKPDLVILLGDRFETLAAAVACLFTKIPIAHIHGGESTEGSLDDMMRHAITKLAHIHFVSHERYARRVIQMGEDPSKVFCVGALAIDNIAGKKTLSKKMLEKKLCFKLGADFVLVTFNPPTAEGKLHAKRQFDNLLKALDDATGVKAVFTKSSPDIYSKMFARLLDKYVSQRKNKCMVRASLGRELYLSALRYAGAVVGNSSSGIIEAPSFGIPTVNIGDRQKGRLQAKSVINCSGKKSSISKTIKKALTENFRKKCRHVKNPYDRGSAAGKIALILKRMHIDDGLAKKRFYDV